MARKKVKDMTPAEKAKYEEKKRVRDEKERLRANNAFLYIHENMKDIDRSDVSSGMIDTWVDVLNSTKAAGVRLKRKDFLILSESCDPFNADFSTYQKLAQWFVDQWRRFKPGATKVHVRGLHYAIQALADTPDAIILPNGNVYDNTESAWSMLENAGKYARNNGLLDPEIFDDRRSREPRVMYFQPGNRDLFVYDQLYGFTDIQSEYGLAFPDFPTIPDFPDLPKYVFTAREQQRYRLEVWIEKSTQEDVVIPVCRKHGITLVTAIGEISQSAVDDAVKRAEGCGDQTTTVILYISDFDPAGQSMPVAAARKIEYSLMTRRSNAHIRLYPVILTYDQCLAYNLPPAPIKETEKRGKDFQRRYDIDGAIELDALESLHPGELAKLLECEILRFRDDTIEKRFRDKQHEVRQELVLKSEDIQKNYEMDELREEYKAVLEELSDIRDAYDELAAEFQDLEERYAEEVTDPLHEWYTDTFEPFSNKLKEKFKKVVDELEEHKPDVNTFDLPQATEVPLDEACLFDSKRAYIPQMAMFKQFAGKFAHLTGNEDDDDLAS
jgi:hypothetical protein